ncbi:hypothetical protein COV94_05000 [Candidatus Woesearchaeota archaeon CG11_big_fil_rev_8_21_14_0_20_57_5]|nr:MAG: hypothetical protein COV94_05000 [Candidatus Woesearchaeota archaeon CG11_big_fil_rev_8_21_14_0_20_57_5]
MSPDWSHVDSASISGHKVHGPKGIGMLLVKDAARHKPLLHGGHQEQGLRPGTTPVPLAVGFAAAADAWQEQDTSRLAALMRSLVSGLSLRGFRVIAPETSRVAIISAVTPGIPGRVLVRALSEQDIFISAGSACEAGSDVPGSALLASGVSAADALHAVRISLHRFSTEADVRTLLASLDLIVPALRQAYGAAVPDAEGPTSDGDTS